MATIKHGSMMVPVGLLERVFDEQALRGIARREFFHIHGALEYYHELLGNGPLDQDGQARVFCEAMDVLQTRWGGVKGNCLSELWDRIPDYGLLGQGQVADVSAA